MNVRVKLFAVAKELAGCDELDGRIARRRDGRATCERRLSSSIPRSQRILPHALWAVDAEYADDAHAVNEQSEIALIPPVSGG